MFKSNKLAVLAALLSLLMLFSAFAVPAFAEETEAPTDMTETTAVEETTAEGDTEAATEAGTGNESEKETTGSATTGSTTTATTTGSDNKGNDGDKDYTGIINLCVGAVILIVLAILCIKFRDKIPAWWKGLKSECGKITWCPKDKLIKNVKVVILVILAIALVIFLLDLAFSEGMVYLGKLFH